MKIFICFILLSIPLFSPASALPSLDDIDSVVEAARQKFRIPGVSIAILINGKTVLLRSYGYRNKEMQPVTENTLFAIASCTKSFTTYLLGQLVDQKKVSWDDPICLHLPTFCLKDRYATENMTLRDLVTHRSGLPSYDELWYGSCLSLEELLENLQYLEPTCTLRQKAQYSNLMYAVAGLVIEKVTGLSYAEVLSEQIFLPLDMQRANTSIDQMQQDSDFAEPFAFTDNSLEPISFCNPHNVLAACGVNASITDVAKWLELQMQTHPQHIRKSTLKEIHSEQVAFGLYPYHTGKWEGYGIGGWPFGYALGWVTGLHQGRYILSHVGVLDGFNSVMGFMPKERMGVAVLMNSANTGLAAPKIAEQLLLLLYQTQ
ncbi:MAG: hypothetical protein RLZZ453_360 [Chlamydiota bacterium]|jgi:CubicO group peptidase (beta-lactamase class C family)